ncbi:MAG: PhoH family protein [Candidatus Nomurabacteria bacterium]|nr:PhoH family protein [Candidatus Nomurabacteria bacterium]
MQEEDGNANSTSKVKVAVKKVARSTKKNVVKVAVKKPNVLRKKTTSKNKVKKIFVLDTNVPLHDPNCLRCFENNDIIIPLVVIQELDPFKKGSDTINLNARSFLRQLDKISSKEGFNGGVSLGRGLGILKVVLNQPYSEFIKAQLYPESVDNSIINIAYDIKQKNINTEVVLVSKDVNVLVKARSLGIAAQDFRFEKVDNVDFLSEEIKTIKVSESIIDSIYENREVLYAIKGATVNQNYILKCNHGNKTAMAVHQEGILKLIKKDDLWAFSVKPNNAEQSFAMNALLDPDISIVTIEGEAGTGKTLAALATAFEQTKKGKNSKYGKIFFARKIISVGAAEIGFLPGDAQDKMNPFMGGMLDNLEYLESLSDKNATIVLEFKNKNIFSVEALGFIRGRSLRNIFFIIDEAQNLTPHEVKTIVSRAGMGTKIVLIGDTHQIDSPFLNESSNGFSYLIDKFRGQPIYSHIHLVKGERSPLAELAGKLL